MSELVLRADNLRKSYGKLLAVDDVSISIARGECVAFLGPNGAGKTTTVEILEGLQTADSGEVRIFGQSISSQKKAILEKAGVLLQETYLYKKLTVRETLNLFASFYKNPADVNEMIRAVRLEDKADVRLEKLSGGQKQRVYLACGLINNPELFFLDEPTTGLDPQARRMIWELLSELKQRGCSLLLTTHYMEEAEFLADRVLIIDHGRIIAQGSPGDLVREHCGEEQIMVRVVDESERALVEKGIVELLPSDANLVQAVDGTLIISTVRSVALVAKLAPFLEKIDSLQLKRSSLEDVFLKLTGRSIRDD